MTTQHDTSGTGLRLRPFRAMRYSAVVGDIAAVTSPPYDVMDRRMIDEMLDQHPRNIVRLILPGLISDPLTCENPYERAATRLQRWRRRGVLTTDERAALYVYEYGDDEHTVCGLVGAVDLRTRHDRVILPHEDVIAGIVADRLALVAAAQANLEPILLVYDGEGDTAPIIDAVRQHEPLMDVRASDGTTHRVWSITAERDIEAMEAALRPRQALIADGHHRYASYLELRSRLQAADADPGAADSGLALLIDQSTWPVQLGAIHRSLSEIALDSLEVSDAYEITGPVRLLDNGPAMPERRGELVLTDGVEQRTLRLRDGARDGWSDARLLHDDLLRTWAVTDDRIGYHHTVEQTLHAARQDGGLAVLLHPATVAEVMEVARAGQMMPRKSTSFGPKPRMGLLMRSFSDEQ